MPVQITSLIAYHDLGLTLGKRQKVVFEAINKFEDVTNAELADFLGWPINTVTPRVFELRKMGIVEERFKRPCKITSRLAIAWRLA